MFVGRSLVLCLDNPGRASAAASFSATLCNGLGMGASTSTGASRKHLDLNDLLHLFFFQSIPGKNICANPGFQFRGLLGTAMNMLPTTASKRGPSITDPRHDSSSSSLSKPEATVPALGNGAPSDATLGGPDPTSGTAPGTWGSASGEP